MKRTLYVLMLVLAVNGLVILGGVWWLWSSGKLDHQKVAAIKAIVFPAPASAVPATQPSAGDPSTRPTNRLDELLALKVPRPPSEQNAFNRDAIDRRMAELDRREQEIMQYQQRVEQKNQQAARAWEELEKQRKALAAQVEQAGRLATDKGFQDSLELYQSMPAKSVKTIFMGMDDRTVVQYLTAMDSGASKRITREFKAPEEIERIKRVLEKMRQPTTMARNENGQ